MKQMNQIELNWITKPHRYRKVNNWTLDAHLSIAWFIYSVRIINKIFQESDEMNKQRAPTAINYFVILLTNSQE